MIISVGYILNYFYTHSTNILTVQMNTVTDESAAEENEEIDGSPVIRSLKLAGDPASQDVKESCSRKD